MPTIEQNQDIAIAVGMLTIEQAGAQLPFLAPCDPALFVQRLLARGSMEYVNFGGSIRIPIDALRAFMQDGARASAKRSALGLPMETLSPLFALGDDGFGAGPYDFEYSWWYKQFGQRLEALLPQFVHVSPQVMTDVLVAGALILKAPAVPTTPPQQLVPTRVTIGKGEGLSVEPGADVTALLKSGAVPPFLNMGEYLLVKRLQESARLQAHRMLLEQSINSFMASPDGSPEDLAARLRGPVAANRQTGSAWFYRADVYPNAVSAAIQALQSIAALTIQKNVSGYTIILTFDGQTMMNLVGTTGPRLACLAF